MPEQRFDLRRPASSFDRHERNDFGGREDSPAIRVTTQLLARQTASVSRRSLP